MLRRVLLAILPVCALAQSDSALDRYLRAPDPAYRYTVRSTARLPGLRMHVLEMVSQRWLTEAEVDKPEWRHWLVVYQPDQVDYRTGLLLINGGSTTSSPPSSPDLLLSALALQSHSIVADLKMVPNQPLKFVGAETARTEDSIIAWTWKKFLETGDERWPARLPMTKAAVRAMDTITDFCGALPDNPLRVDRFVIAGASKRGWTTWTTAAVDRRVSAIIPMVIDALNVDASFVHHYRAYGFWAPAIRDYEEAGLMAYLGTPAWRKLMEIEDPWEYRDRLTIPKFIFNSSGDQFFLPDSSQFYFNDLKGEKYLRYVPNTDHGVTRRSDAGESLLAFYQSIVENWKRPEFDWTISKDGKFTITCKDKPSAVKLWTATNPDARDFRLEKLGPAYKSTDLTAGPGGVYTYQLPKPEKGFTAGFIELTFPTPGGTPWKFTTGVKVVPDVYPFPAPSPALPTGATKLD